MISFWHDHFCWLKEIDCLAPLIWTEDEEDCWKLLELEEDICVDELIDIWNDKTNNFYIYTVHILIIVWSRLLRSTANEKKKYFDTCWEEDDIDFISDEDEDDICCELTADTCLLLKPLLSAWVEVAKSALIPVDSLLACKVQKIFEVVLGQDKCKTSTWTIIACPWSTSLRLVICCWRAIGEGLARALEDNLTKSGLRFSRSSVADLPTDEALAKNSYFFMLTWPVVTLPKPNSPGRQSLGV